MYFIRYIIVILIFFAFSAVNAQQLNNNGAYKNSPADYAVSTYTIANGLPSRNTTTVIKDRQGFIWVGTENGLCKFDGYRFKTFTNRKGDSTSISNNFINALIEDSRGRLWVGTMDGLNLFDPFTEKFTRFTHNDNIKGSVSNNKIWALFQSADNRVWIGTDDGFNLFVEKNHSFKVYKPNAANQFAMRGKSVNGIIQQGDYLWLGNWGEGLNKFDLKTGRFYNYKQSYDQKGKNPNDIWTLCLDDNGKICVGTYWKGLFYFNPATAVFKQVNEAGTDNQSVFTLLNIGGGMMLVGGNERFWWVDTRTGKWEKAGNIANNPHGHAIKDNEGLIWIASQGGLTKVDRQQNKFAYYPVQNVQWTISGMLADNGVLWVGTNKGLCRYDFDAKKLSWFRHTADPRSISSNEIRNLYKDHEGKLWIATENGFDEYSATSSTFIHHTHHSFLGKLYNEDVFRDIIELQSGVYGLATDAGFKIYDSRSGVFTHYYATGKPGAISNNHLNCLFKDDKGMVWIGTNGGGLNLFNPATKQFTSYTNNEHIKTSISDNIIQSVFEDAQHRIWVCTPDGLNLYRPETDSFITYSKDNGFSSSVFYDILQDKAGTLWITNETGITSFNPDTKAVRNFDEADGVLDNSAICQDKQGGIYLVGRHGFEYFNPLSVTKNTHVPPVYFSDFQVFNKTVEPSADGPLKQNINIANEITLKYAQSEFSIEFVALNYTRSEKNAYAYFMEGFDTKWNYVGSQRKATYTNLDPGTYQFHVRAANNDGIWNNTGKTITIVVTPPWYKTNWAYAIYMFCIGLMIFGYVKYREHQARLRYEIKLAHLQSEQEKEINERKLSFFTNISHEFRTPLTLIINPLKEVLYRESEIDVSALGTVYRNAKRLLSLVDQLLLFRKAEAGDEKLKVSRLNIADLCKEIFLCFTHQANAKNITFEFICQNDQLQLYADREKFEIILFNLTGNAMKFTPERGSIRLTVTDDDSNVFITLSDTGCGIPEGTGDNLYKRFYQEKIGNGSFKGGFGIGLYLVKNFVDRHKGDISYESKPGMGTTFNLKFLKGRAHLNDQHILDDSGGQSYVLKELIEDEMMVNHYTEEADAPVFDGESTAEQQTLLIIDDNDDFREYLKQIFKIGYKVHDAANGVEGLEKIRQLLPDMVISDVMMDGMTGIEMCAKVRADMSVSHIPIILLTSSSSSEIKLKGLEGGADDYISKPFDKDILRARVAGILKSKNTLQKYFYNEITLNKNPHKISIEYKDFLENCISIVEQHLKDPDFNIQVLASELDTSASTLYKKIKFISGQSPNSFIRFIRLRRAAHLFIHTDATILETAFEVGINDIKYFREQFKKVFNMNPSQYIKKYRRIFSNGMVNQEQRR